MEINSKGTLTRREVMRTYDRTWVEIEDMLEDAKAKRAQWVRFYEHAKKTQDKDSMKDAARNAKALEGVEKLSDGCLVKAAFETP